MDETSIDQISAFCDYQNYENENEYEQKYPVFYASATEGIKTGNYFRCYWADKNEPVIENGMWVNYVVKDNRPHHTRVTFYQNCKEFYENGDFSFCFDFSCLRMPGGFSTFYEGEGENSQSQILSRDFSVIRFGNIEIKMIFSVPFERHYEIPTNPDYIFHKEDSYIYEMSVFQNGEKILRIMTPLNPSYEEGETVTFILTHKNEEGTSLLEKRYNSHLIGIGETENNINVPESSDIATSDCDLEVPDFGRLEVKVGVNNILTYNRVLSVEEMRNMPKENQDF